MSVAEVDPSISYEGPDLLGASPGVVEIRRKCARYAALDAPVVISGGSGTGKSLLATALHRESRARTLRVLQCRELSGESKASLMALLAPQPRQAIPCTCGAERLSATNLLIEDLDAASGASEPIASIVCELVGLAGEVERRGAERLRLIITTRRGPDSDVAMGAPNGLRGQGLRLHLPPLRTRLEDIETIAAHELSLLTSEAGRDAPRLDEGALRLLRAHSWPDNVRELLFVLRHMMAVRPEAEAFDRFDAREALDALRKDFTPRARFEERERTRLQAVLDENQWNVSETARRLGRSRGWLRRRMATLELA